MNIEFAVAAVFGLGWWLWFWPQFTCTHSVGSWGLPASPSTLPYEVNERFIVVRGSIFGEYQLPLTGPCLQRGETGVRRAQRTTRPTGSVRYQDAHGWQRKWSCDAAVCERAAAKAAQWVTR